MPDKLYRLRKHTISIIENQDGEPVFDVVLANRDGEKKAKYRPYLKSEVAKRIERIERMLINERVCELLLDGQVDKAIATLKQSDKQ